MIVPFFLSLIALFINQVFFPNLHLLVFSPFLAILVMKKNRIPALWIASFCGLIIDLLSSSLPFGLNSLIFTLTTFLIFSLKKWFFEKKALSCAILTYLISSLMTLHLFFFVSMFGHPPPLSLKTFLLDIWVMPFADALYSFFWFSCPTALYNYIKIKKRYRIAK